MEDRKFSQFDVMALARNILFEYPDLRTAVTDVSAIQAKGQDTRLFQMTLQGPDFGEAGVSEIIKEKLGEIEGLVDVDSTLSLRKPELQVVIDRERAADLGIQVQTIANTLNVLVAGQPISLFKEGTEQYDIWLRADRSFRSNPQSLETLTVPSQTAGLVQLTSVASLG